MTVVASVAPVSEPVSAVQQVGVGSSLGLGLSLSRPLAVVAETVSVVAETMTVVASVAPVSEPVSAVQQVGVSSSLGLGLSLSRPLAVVAKPLSAVQQVGVSSSLGLGFRLSGADGRQGENYELGERGSLRREFWFQERNCFVWKVSM